MSDEIDFSEHFYYDETSPTGLRRLHDVPYRGNSAKFHARAGNPVGTFSAGYWQAPLLKKTYRAHRIIWELEVGPIPAGMLIDHIDGDTKNNRLSNLRLVTPSGNVRNRGMDSRNSTGTTGVMVESDGSYLAMAAKWWDEYGVPRRKMFNVNEFGLLPAHKMAAEYRKKMIDRLNSLGLGYTERHGT